MKKIEAVWDYEQNCMTLDIELGWSNFKSVVSNFTKITLKKQFILWNSRSVRITWAPLLKFHRILFWHLIGLFCHCSENMHEDASHFGRSGSLPKSITKELLVRIDPVFPNLVFSTSKYWARKLSQVYCWTICWKVLRCPFRLTFKNKAELNKANT